MANRVAGTGGWFHTVPMCGDQEQEVDAKFLGLLLDEFALLVRGVVHHQPDDPSLVRQPDLFEQSDHALGVHVSLLEDADDPFVDGI